MRNRRGATLLLAALIVITGVAVAALRGCDDDVPRRAPTRDADLEDRVQEPAPVATRRRRSPVPGDGKEDATTDGAIPASDAQSRMRDAVVLGKLVDEDGAPIGDGAITLRLNAVSAGASGWRAGIGNPAPDGTFRLSVGAGGAVDLHVRTPLSSPFASTALRDVELTDEPIEVTLKRGLVIRGSITWPATVRGASGRQITVVALPPGCEPVKATVDADGRFVTGALDPDLHYRLVAVGAEYRGTVADAAPGSTYRIALRPRHETDISGRVVYPDGSTARGAYSVWIRAVEDRAVKGGFLRDRVGGVSDDGAFRLRAFEGVEYTIGVGGGIGLAPFELSETVMAGQHDVVVQMRKGIDVSGRVAGLPEKRTGRVWIEAAYPGGRRTLRQTALATDGTFNFIALEPGVEHVVSLIRGNGYRFEVARIVPPLEDLVIDLGKQADGEGR